MTRVLLTGAGGFVGHHTLEHLLVNTDWEIVCLDSFRHRGKTDRIREVLAGFPGPLSYADVGQRVKVLTHDLCVPISPQLDHEIGFVDYVISMASDSHVDRSCVEPRPFIERNVQLVLTLLEWMRHRHLTTAGIEKFIHVSTDEVYGPAAGTHLHYEGEPHRPSNPYSASKACQEDIVFSYWRTFGLPVAVSNTMNIIGERQDPEKFVPKVIRAISRGEKLEIHAGTTSHGGAPVTKPGSRYYLHARNQADALLFLLNTQPFPVFGQHPTMQRWNVVGEREVDNLEMAQMIAEYAGVAGFEYELTDFHSSRPGHDLRYALDGKKLEDLGWLPPVALEESLAHTVRWTLDHPAWMLD